MNFNRIRRRVQEFVANLIGLPTKSQTYHQLPVTVEVRNLACEETMSEKKTQEKELDIDLESDDETEYLKWFLACLLFGKPIQQEVAKQAYLRLVQDDIASPEAILKAFWDKLVEVLDRAHYVPFDFSTATKLPVRKIMVHLVD